MVREYQYNGTKNHKLSIFVGQRSLQSLLLYKTQFYSTLLFISRFVRNKNFSNFLYFSSKYIVNFLQILLKQQLIFHLDEKLLL